MKAILKISIIECVIGIFVFNSDNEVIESILFPKQDEKIVKALKDLQTGVIIEELHNLIDNLMKKGMKTLVLENYALAQEIRKEFDLECYVEKNSTAGEVLRSNLSTIAKKLGYIKSTKELSDLIHNVSNIIARSEIRLRSGRRDFLLAQAIMIVDDLDETFNLFSNRVKEWYGLYFPELGSLIEKNELYLRLISSIPRREYFTEERLLEVDLAITNSKEIANMAQTSMGAEFEGRDLTKIRDLSLTLLQLYNLRHELEEYINEMMTDIAPNIRSLVGSIIGARLLAFVGGLENLVKKSASKIQVLGAEKALYRSLRTGSRPPKHGLIFQHPIIHQAPIWQRGKIARSLAGKLAIAARLDFYGGEYKGEELQKAFQKRVEEIREKYEAPKKKRQPRDNK